MDPCSDRRFMVRAAQPFTKYQFAIHGASCSLVDIASAKKFADKKSQTIHKMVLLWNNFSTARKNHKKVIKEECHKLHNLTEHTWLLALWTKWFLLEKFSGALFDKIESQRQRCVWKRVGWHPLVIPTRWTCPFSTWWRVHQSVRVSLSLFRQRVSSANIRAGFVRRRESEKRQKLCTQLQFSASAHIYVHSSWLMNQQWSPKKLHAGV